MRRSGRIIVRGIVQGVGFRPFVYASAHEYGIAGYVKNLGSEVEIYAKGDKFEDFLASVSTGPPIAHIDYVSITPWEGPYPEDFLILPSSAGTMSGMIPPDIATCDTCLADIGLQGGRYDSYWATSCVNCGPRYSIINELPYDRERTSMILFPMCADCFNEYTDPSCRRHHAQTIACEQCGPRLVLFDRDGNAVDCDDVIKETACLLDSGALLALRGIGGFHIACIEERAGELKKRLGRSEQPFAVMVRNFDCISEITNVSASERLLLESASRPIVVLEKKDRMAHNDISNLHTIGCMLPYTGLHHLLFSHLSHPLLVMTSANMPGYPMITDIERAMASLNQNVDFFLSHDRRIVNRCDDSVIRDGFIIRLSRGMAPKRMRLSLGEKTILGVGPELNSNITIYKDNFATTSPHVGNVRNPGTFAYLKETVSTLSRLLGAEEYDLIAHDAHPQFLSTRYARELAEDGGVTLVPVQHHRAHIAAATQDPCIGITIDGVGYGDDGTIWGGEIFAGKIPDYERVGHLEVVPMAGGDLATTYPERILYGILPEPDIEELLLSRGWNDLELDILKAQLDKSLNVALTSSTGRVLDSVSALLGICSEKTYDGEPAMKLESAAIGGRASEWDLSFFRDSSSEVLSTRGLMKRALREYKATQPGNLKKFSDIAASFQYNLARGIAGLAIHAARDCDISLVVLSGGVAYNRMIRETIIDQIHHAGLDLHINAEYPLGDGCISFGQCRYAAEISKSP
ncbi:MAG: carbamoyltransferase HypF [Methanoregulaceae archaeon]|nr:carbamoyltransferase HypF [Methanoregulaceae archaeon]